MNATSLQAIQNLPVIAWQEQPVITTESLAIVYEVDVKNIQQNFTRNAERFTEGQHYFKLEGEQLTLLKLVSAHIPKQTKHLILWTERGTVRHAKMLGTDKAWDVQDQLEQFYFSQKSASNQTEKTEEPVLTKADIERLIESKLKTQPASLPPSYSSGHRTFPVNVAFKEDDLVYILEQNGYRLQKIN